MSGYRDFLVRADEYALLNGMGGDGRLPVLIGFAVQNYLNEGMGYDGFDGGVRRTWKSAAAFGLRKVLDDADPCADLPRLAVVAVSLEFSPQLASWLIARSVLHDDAASRDDVLDDFLSRDEACVPRDEGMEALTDQVVDWANSGGVDAGRMDAGRRVLDALAATSRTGHGFDCGNVARQACALRALLDLAVGDVAAAYRQASDVMAADPLNDLAFSLVERTYTLMNPDPGASGVGLSDASGRGM
ncbi:MAG: hypothetical protein LKI21_07580 [Bifidobacterium crudilactis]|jgi:hypothetical protein|nr:hypothetical protein [Bifidobacterium crudilactis]